MGNKDCANMADNLRNCACSYVSCNRRGKCCECISYHWSRKELPGCLFPPEVERTYDRSLKRFIQAYGNK
ncbi:MAG: hypothetical protein GX041_03270 [Clostridiales bacterium]|jgi:hypothetical protein|nr:hypothetical protein [Clostridiales bacterium]